MRGLHAKCDCDGRRPHGTGKFARRVAGKGESAKREGDSDRDMERITGKKLTAGCGSMIMLGQSSGTLQPELPLAGFYLLDARDILQMKEIWRLCVKPNIRSSFVSHEDLKILCVL